jgi:site-specific recombinase XerD
MREFSVSIKRRPRVVDRSGAAQHKGCCGGPLAPHLDGFVARLVAEGYAQKTVCIKCALVTDLSRWLERRKVALVDINEEQLQQFHASRRRRLGVRVRRADAPTSRQLLGYLRDRGCIRRLPQNVDRTTLGKLTLDFERFLSSERGLSPSTLINYLPIVRRFITQRFKDQALRLQYLRPHDLHRFILNEARRLSRSRAKLTVTALRSFLRFLLQRGAIKTDLATGLPGVAHWRLSHLPKSLPPKHVEQLLDSCDRSTRSGQRDYAILLLLARLGLRGGEVLALTLEDLDWEHGEIVVHGKSQRLERLPLPEDVGEALANYLQHTRPVCSTRSLFIRLQAPLRGLRQSAICCIVHRALERAGLNPDFRGAHLLRHSLATEMLRKGATLSEIGQLLRHAQPTTTQIYAKVDIEALRGIALPWMGGTS